ncbi:MAG: hypothetical protein EA412_08940 [Chitinophagaceae bacterium]|nr:MAG: hypothetical protein EA412_08940 [Chitinophagaceae bacterium]
MIPTDYLFYFLYIGIFAQYFKFYYHFVYLSQLNKIADKSIFKFLANSGLKDFQIMVELIIPFFFPNNLQNLEASILQKVIRVERKIYFSLVLFYVCITSCAIIAIYETL